ncbi:hypothetical protein BD311DRAFT_802436 [Dichomitus squalens]|uniref:Uncharacterized protein n=1 Tax=Dichomitus squalens TaxID=114155 RepID=A0A4V2K1T3_9APHY|nr:hypothetical protein BD311DRAFT_802436 [Dichomitus squalens]
MTNILSFTAKLPILEPPTISVSETSSTLEAFLNLKLCYQLSLVPSYEPLGTRSPSPLSPHTVYAFAERAGFDASRSEPSTIPAPSCAPPASALPGSPNCSCVSFWLELLRSTRYSDSHSHLRVLLMKVPDQLLSSNLPVMNTQRMAKLFATFGVKDMLYSRVLSRMSSGNEWLHELRNKGDSSESNMRVIVEMLHDVAEE